MAFSERGGAAGSWAQTTSSEWFSQLNALNTADAFKPFAGSISISTAPDIEWYSGLSPIVPEGQIDLYSVILHELGHVLGIGGNSNAWNANIENGFFIGEHVTTLSGGGIAVDEYQSHFVDIEWDNFPLLMNSAIYDGERYNWSELETAVLLDLGYVAIPEPATVGITALGFGLLVLSRRKSQRLQRS